MHLGERFWAFVTYVANIFTLNTFEGPGIDHQSPLQSVTDSQSSLDLATDLTATPLAKGPTFAPPGRDTRSDGEGAGFQCDYTAMVGFTNCSTPDNRGCWLRNSSGFEYNVDTNYEDTNLTPVGIHRTYYLNLTDSWVNADGLNFTAAKLFNNTYPGPWIEACWGDVRKLLKYEAPKPSIRLLTLVHRMLQSSSKTR